MIRAVRPTHHLWDEFRKLGVELGGEGRGAGVTERETTHLVKERRPGYVQQGRGLGQKHHPKTTEKGIGKGKKRGGSARQGVAQGVWLYQKVKAVLTQCSGGQVEILKKDITWRRQKYKRAI